MSVSSWLSGTVSDTRTCTDATAGWPPLPRPGKAKMQHEDGGYPADYGFVRYPIQQPVFAGSRRTKPALSRRVSQGPSLHRSYGLPRQRDSLVDWSVARFSTDLAVPSIWDGESMDALPQIPEKVDVAEESQHLHGTQLHLLMTAMSLSILLITLSGTIIATAIPQITNDFDSVQDIGWYASAFILANCVLLPLGGKLYSRFETKVVMMVFLATFLLGSCICATAVTSSMLICGRVVAGMGSAGIFTGAFTVVGAAAPIEDRPKLVGIVMSIASIGQVSGPLIGGALTQRASWRWCFWIDVPSGLSAIVLLFFIVVPNGSTNRPTTRSFKEAISGLDLVGFALFAPGCVLLLLAIQFGGTRFPWRSASIIGLFCGAGVIFTVWLFWNRRKGRDAMVPFNILRSRIVAFSCITAMLQWAGMILLAYYLPLWFQTVKAAGPLEGGVDVLPTLLSQSLLGLVSGILVSKLGYYLPWAMGGSVLVTIGSGLMTTMRPKTPQAEWIIWQIISGAGRGMAIQMPIIASQNYLPKEDIPVGTGIVSFCQYFGATLASSLGQTIFLNKLPDALARFAPHVSAEQVLSGGATSLQNLQLSSDEAVSVRDAYNEALTQTFILAVGTGAVACLTSLGMGWRNIKAKSGSGGKE